MKKKFYLISTLYFVTLFSCNTNVTTMEKLLINKNIDISRPHNIESKYFMQSKKDTILRDSSILKIFVINRIGGESINNGTFFVEGSEKKHIDFITSNFTIKLKKGKYYFNIKPPIGNLIDCSTDEIILSENSVQEIYFLLGSLVQK